MFGKGFLAFRSTAIFTFLAVFLAFANSSASAQTDQKCPLVIKQSSGNLKAFYVTNADPTELVITPLAGNWRNVEIIDRINATVYVSPFGGTQPVIISGIKPDLGAPGSFTIIATDEDFRTITINVVLDCSTPSQGCTRTQGYWKNHPNAWAVDNLSLGSRNYTKAELLQIFRTPVRGNGLISLSHQLIAAKLNRAAGTSVPTDVDVAIAAADMLIGNRTIPPIGNGTLSTSSTSGLATILDRYNNGVSPDGPPHCSDIITWEIEPIQPVKTDEKQ